MEGDYNILNRTVAASATGAVTTATRASARRGGRDSTRLCNCLMREPKAVEKISSRVRSCVAVMSVCVLGAGVAQAATTWYQKAEVRDQDSAALTDLSFWTKDGGVTAGSGAPTANDELIGYNNWRLRLKGAVCPAKSLQLGTASTYCEVIDDIDGGKALTTTFQNDGLKLFKGMWSFNARVDFMLAGPITVLSPSTDPFAFACGNGNYTGNTETLSGPISGAAGASLILGKSRSGFDSAKQTTFCLTGDLAGYAGTLDVQAHPSRITKVNGTDYGTRLKLGTTTSPCAVNVGRGCVLSACDSTSVTTVSRVSFETGTRYEPVVSGGAMSCLNVTGALTLAEPIEVYLNGTLQRNGPTRLPILTAPAATALTERDFHFRAGPNCDSIGLYLQTETDSETGKWTLYVVDPRSADATVWYQKAEVRDQNTAALTDLSFWTKDGGATAGSGTPTANDELIGYNNWRLRFKGATCPAKSLQLGTAGTYCEVIDDYDSGRAYTTTFQNDGLKLVKGVWSFNANVGFTLAGPITVFSPSTDAFAFSYCNSTYTGNTATLSGPISGAAGTSLILGKSGRSAFDSAKQSTFRLIGDLSGYAGTLDVQAHPSRITEVDGSDYGTRLKLHTTTSPCSVNVGKGCVLSAYDTASTTTVARVRFDTGTRYEPAGGEYAMSCLKVTESLELAGPVEFYFNTTLRGTKQQYRLPVLMAPATSTFTTNDFKLVIGGTLYNLDLHLEVGTDPETGMRTLYVVTWGFTIQKTSYSKEGQRDTPNPNVSSLTNAAAWWDGEVPHAGAAYRSNMALRTLDTPTEDYVFPGVSLWLQNSAQLLLTVKSFAVPTFYASGNGTGNLIGIGSSCPGSTVKADRFVFSDTVILRAHASHYLTLEGEIEGAADLKLSGWSLTGYPAAFYELNGNNEKFTGTVLVTQDEYRPQYATFEKGFPTLYVNDGRNLGGPRADFTPRALTLTHQARLSVSNNVTVTLADDLNRGVYVLEKGRFHAKNAESVLEVLQPVLLSGHLWTEGDGLVVLGGPMTFEADDGGAIVETPRAGSNLVTVASALVAAHPDCLNGCDVTIAAGGRLILDADKLGATGLDLARPGSALHLDASFGGRLPLFITTARPAPAKPTEPTIIGLVTVSDGEMVAEVRGMLRKIPRVWPKVPQHVVEIHDDEKGQTTFALDIRDQGMMMIVR